MTGIPPPPHRYGLNEMQRYQRATSVSSPLFTISKKVLPAQWFGSRSVNPKRVLFGQWARTAGYSVLTLYVVQSTTFWLVQDSVQWPGTTSTYELTTITTTTSILYGPSTD